MESNFMVLTVDPLSAGAARGGGGIGGGARREKDIRCEEGERKLGEGSKRELEKHKN